jgi:hypothetical protein
MPERIRRCSVMATRAHWMGLELVVGDAQRDLDPAGVFGAHLQTPDTEGRLHDFSATIAALHAAGALACVGTDPLALMLLKTPGEMGTDLAIGSAQRFGIPMGYGGPHAAFMSARAELVRLLPGRIVGVSKDSAGNTALRMALQTREQHIRREKATSNICTAQALLANMASFYAVYHGPEGLLRIALRVNAMARLLVRLVAQAGTRAPLLAHRQFYDTVVFDYGPRRTAAQAALARAQALRINLRRLDGGRVGMSLDETVGIVDVDDLAYVITGIRSDATALERAVDATGAEPESVPATLRRRSPVLAHPVFSMHRSEAAFVRYLKRLENRDLSLVHSMIPLGSCTMKLNAAAEMAPVSWPEFADLHPLAPAGQAQGYGEMLRQLGGWLARSRPRRFHSPIPARSGTPACSRSQLAARAWAGPSRRLPDPSSAHGASSLGADDGPAHRGGRLRCGRQHRRRRPRRDRSAPRPAGAVIAYPSTRRLRARGIHGPRGGARPADGSWMARPQRAGRPGPGGRSRRRLPSEPARPSASRTAAAPAWARSRSRPRAPPALRPLRRRRGPPGAPGRRRRARCPRRPSAARSSARSPGCTSA